MQRVGHDHNNLNLPLQQKRGYLSVTSCSHVPRLFSVTGACKRSCCCAAVSTFAHVPSSKTARWGIGEAYPSYLYELAPAKRARFKFHYRILRNQSMTIILTNPLTDIPCSAATDFSRLRTSGEKNTLILSVFSFDLADIRPTPFGEIISP